MFAGAGIAIVLPEPEEQVLVHERYMGELVNGLVLDETRDRLATVVERLRQRSGIQGVILGGTELSLLFRGPTIGGVEVLDTTRIHVADALTRLLS